MIYLHSYIVYKLSESYRSIHLLMRSSRQLINEVLSVINNSQLKVTAF